MMLYSLLIQKFVLIKERKVLKITKRDWLRNFFFRPLSHCSRSTTEAFHSVDSLSQFFLYSFIAKICHHGELNVWSFVMFYHFATSHNWYWFMNIPCNLIVYDDHDLSCIHKRAYADTVLSEISRGKIRMRAIAFGFVSTKTNELKIFFKINFRGENFPRRQ